MEEVAGLKPMVGELRPDSVVVSPPTRSISQRDGELDNGIFETIQSFGRDDAHAGHRNARFVEDPAGYSAHRATATRTIPASTRSPGLRAARAIRQRWMLWLLPFGVLLFGAGMVTDLLDADTTWWDLGVSAGWTAIPAFVLAYQVVQLRPIRRYLGRRS